jgi:hypothetical protein
MDPDGSSLIWRRQFRLRPSDTVQDVYRALSLTTISKRLGFFDFSDASLSNAAPSRGQPATLTIGDTHGISLR